MMFTIAIPVHNGARSLDKAIESCLEQRYAGKYEVLVVDNASSDQTQEIAQGCSDGRVRYERFDELVGMYENHNRCLELGRGQYLVFCHADDELLPNCLSDYARKLEQRNYPEKYVCWGRSVFRDEYVFEWYRGFGQLDQMLVGANAFLAFCSGWVVPSGSLFSRKQFFDLGGYLLCLHKAAASDWVTMLYLAEHEFVFELSSFLVFRRQAASTNISLSKREREAKCKDAFCTLTKHLPKARLIEMARIARHRLGIRHFSLLEKQVLRSGWFTRKEYLNRIWGLLRTRRIGFREGISNLLACAKKAYRS